MSNNHNTGAPSQAVLGLSIGAAAIIVFALSMTMVSNGSETSFIEAERDAGQLVGQGFVYGLVVWAIAYFAVIRKASKSWKWGSFGALVLVSIAGAFFGAG